MPLDEQNRQGSSWSTWEKWKDYREPFERRWYLSLAYLVGHHYVRWNMTSRRLEDAVREDVRLYGNSTTSNKVRLVSNHIMRLFRQKLSDFLKIKPIIKIEPSTEDEADITAAKTAQGVTIHLQRKHSFQSFQRVLWTLMMCFGRASVYTFWNPRKGQLGSEELQILSPFETFWPKSRWPREPNEVMCMQSEDVETIKAIYGKDIPAETDLTTSSPESQLRLLMERKEATLDENMARVLKHFVLPNEKYPKGLYRVEAKEGVVLYEGPLPQECFDDEGEAELPITPFDFYEIPLSEYPRGYIDDLISPQREYNFKISKITNLFKKMSGKIYVPFGANLKEPLNSEDGQVVYYDASAGLPPSPVAPPGIPQSFFVDLARTKVDMEDIAASHDVSNSKVPSGVKSGKAITALQERDESQMAPTVITAEERMGKVFRMLLRIIQQNYEVSRTLTVVGKGKRYSIEDFTGGKIAGNKTVTVSMGSSLPHSRTSRHESVIALVQAGLMSPAEARERLDLIGDTELPNNVDLMAAKQAAEDMLNNGITVQVNDFDNHAVHLKILNEYRKDPDFQKNAPEEIKSLFDTKANLHMMALRKELEAQQAAQINQQNNQPNNQPNVA